MRSWLLAIVLAVGLPLVTVQAWLLFAIHGDAVVREQEDLRSEARLVALRLEDFTTELEIVLTLTRGIVRSDAPAARIDTALNRLSRALPPYITSLALYTPDGRILGHSALISDSVRRALTVRDRRYFIEAMRRQDLAIGEAVVGRLTGVQTLGAARAVRDSSGRVLHVQATTTLVTRLRELLLVPGLAEGARVRLMDSTGALVAATDIRADSAVDGMPTLPPDSGLMLVGRAPVPGTPWEVVVQTPVDRSLGAGSGRLRVFIVTAFVVLVLAGALALALAQRIATPLLALGRTARAMSTPPYAPAPVTVQGPRVVRDLAHAFNEMSSLVTARTAEVERRERQYRLVTDGVPMLIGYVDAAGRVQFLNRRAELFFGASLATLAGRPILELLGASGETALAKALGAALEGRTAELETRLDPAEERAVDVTVSCVPHRGESGEVEGAFVLIADVTASRKLESQLRQAQRMDAIGRLAGGIAHDFNNLLTVILTSLEFALDEARTLPGAQAVVADLTTARESGERAAALTKQLLTYSRQSAGTREEVDLNAVAAAAERMLRRLIGAQIQMHLHLAPSLHTVLADRSQLEQVLVNLVINARDAMPHGGHLTIETRDVELDETYAAAHARVVPGPYVCLEVSDTGTGIAPEVLPHIFEPFFTTKGVGEGTGLGLAVCYGIVQQHGGVITAYSQRGKGTTFKVMLPAGGEPSSGPSAPLGAEPAGGTETILLVEDDDAVRRTARRALEERGYTLLVASDAQEALAMMSGAAPHIDLLLTDFVMPGLSGAELATELRERIPGLRVLIVSGYARSGVRRAATIPEGMPYLAKPYTARSLAAKVREVLDGA